MLELYDSNLSLITSGKPSITRLCGTDELAAGTYYVKITDELNDEVISYDISLTVTPCETSGGGGSGCCDSWSKLLTTDRFELVMNNQAVLDKETCLVWEQSPDITGRTWISALSHCFTKKVGGRGGWRAPTIEELHSLVDNTQSAPTIPAALKTLTSNVQSSFYWSSTTNAFNPTQFAWSVSFVNGFVSSIGVKDSVSFVWCVRGGQGHDAY
jgi:hypothetical protein